jgi:TonB family protein
MFTSLLHDGVSPEQSHPSNEVEEGIMFETSVVESRAAAPQRHFGLLSLSVLGHTAAVAAFVAAGLQSSRFPTNAPDEVRFFQLVAPVSVPPPLGTPDGARKPAATPAPAQKPAPRAAVVAPDRIPSVVVPVEPSTGSGDPAITGAGGGEGVFGSPDGVPGGIDFGQPGGTEPAGDVIHQPGGEVKSPVVIRRVSPEYPRIALLGRKGGIVRLRCVIDKTGRIRDPEVIFSTFDAFNKPALDAVRQWAFAPGILHGKPVDTWFELTVTFSVK